MTIYRFWFFVETMDHCRLRRVADWLVAAAILMVCHSGVSVAEVGDAFAKFDEYANAALADWKTPGMAVAVVRNGELVFARGYGLRKVGESNRVNSKTVFPIASITKSFNATGIAMLVDVGRLKWNDPVIKHLPQFLLHDPYLTREVTIADLLSHRTRLEDPVLLAYSGSVDRSEMIRRAKFLKPVALFRTGCGYNNLMVDISGETLERITGQQWEDFIRERIFVPLDMTSTVSDVLELQDSENFATTYVQVEEELKEDRSWNLPLSEGWRRYREAVRPDGSICSTVEDMAKFLIFHLSKGEYSGKRLLRSDTVMEMQALQSVMALKQTPDTNLPYPKFLSGFGYGWQVRDYRGRRLVLHGGSTGTVIAMMPEEKLGLVVLTNFGSGVQYMVMHDVFDRLLGIPRSWTNKDWITEIVDNHHRDNEAAEAQLEAERNKEITPKFPMEHYSGTYESNLYGKIEVGVASGKLTMQYGPNCNANLVHWQGEQFRGTFVVRYPEDLFFTFGAAEKGQGTRLDVEEVRSRKLLSTFKRTVNNLE